MNSDVGLYAFILIISLVCLIIYFIPIIIAFNRNHEYRWIIFVLTIVGGWTGLLWIAALIWAIFPSNKTLIDPVVGNATGLGYRNAGDALGAVEYGRIRGFNSEQAKNIGSFVNADTSFSSKVDALEKLDNLKKKGILSDNEFEIEKHKIMNGKH